MTDENEILNDPGEISKLIFERTERLKELAAINQTNDILREGKPIDETLQQLAKLLPAAWQYPEFTVCRIAFKGKEYTSPGFHESNWLQRESFESIDGGLGYIDIFYLKEFIRLDEGPFLKEERHLINNLASAVVGYLNSIAAKELLKKSRTADKGRSSEKLQCEIPVNGKQLLQRFLNKNNSDRDVYHDSFIKITENYIVISNI